MPQLPPRWALVLGSEHHGVRREVRAVCQGRLKAAMDGPQQVYGPKKTVENLWAPKKKKLWKPMDNCENLKNVEEQLWEWSN